MKIYEVIRFNDLKEEVQQNIKQRAFDMASNDADLVLSIGSSDPFDMCIEDANRVNNTILGAVERACDRAWTELEVNIKC